MHPVGQRLFARRAFGQLLLVLDACPIRPAEEEFSWRCASRTFTDPLAPGAQVAVHWGQICDELEETFAAELEHRTDLQVEATNQRLDPAARRSPSTTEAW